MAEATPRTMNPRIERVLPGDRKARAAGRKTSRMRGKVMARNAANVGSLFHGKPITS
jgi:hypothetical protein